MSSKKYFKLRLGTVHGLRALEDNDVDLQRVSMNLVIGGDLVDLISLRDKKYQINFGLPSEIENDLQVSLVIQTANKVKQVVFGRIAGSLNSLLALSNNKVEKLWIDIDPSMTSSKAMPQPVKISDAKSSRSPARLSVMVFTGSKDSTELDDVENLCTVASEESESEDSFQDESAFKEENNPLDKKEDIRYLMPSHMPSYLRIDQDIKEGLVRLTELMKEYSNFDVLALERDVTRTLELELDKQSAEYKRHNRATEKRLQQAVHTVEQCIILKDEIIQTRTQEISQAKKTYAACLNFQRQDDIEREQLQLQRELIMQVDAELRRAHNIHALAQMDESRLSTLEQQERKLVHERHQLVLRMLQLALADVNHHLNLIKNRSKISEQDIVQMQQFLEQILQLSREAKERYTELEQRIKLNGQEYQQKAATFKEELKIILEENNQLKAKRAQQDRALEELQQSLQAMLQTEQKISGEWLNGVNTMEEKVLTMKESMTMTLQQLRENTRLMEQYKIRLQTMKIRIAIETKVKESYEHAKFQERYSMLEVQLQEQITKQEALQVQVGQIQTGWNDYYASALTSIKDRFTSINSTTFVAYMEKQNLESEKLDRELQAITGEVQQLEMDVQSTTSTQASAKGDLEELGQEEIVQLKFQAEQKLIRFRSLLNKKSVLYAELLNNARILMDMNDQLIANEEQKLHLMEEIDVSTLEILQKRQIAVDLQENLNSLKENYQHLKQDIRHLDQQAEFLKGRVRDCEDEFDQMQEVVMLKKLEIEQLEKQAGVKAPVIEPSVAVKVSSSAYYRPIKGDLVDEMVGNNLTDMQCTLPVRRLSDGYYLFGTKKIFVKVNKGNVIVRQAGGYQNFLDFVELSMGEEQQKIDDLKRTGEWDQEALVEYYLQEINATPSATGMATYSNRQPGISPMGGRRSPQRSPPRSGQASPTKSRAGGNTGRAFGSSVGRGL